MSRKMKDSGIEWIGEIPEDWEIRKYKHFAISGMGKTILKEDLDEIGFPVYSATQDDTIFGYINKVDLVLNKGDIVIPARGNSIGCVYLVKEDIATCTQTTIYSKIRNIIKEYVLYCSQGLKEHWFEFDNTAIPQITVSQIQNNLIPVPPINQQNKIANFLYQKVSEINHILEKTRESIEEYKKYKQSLIAEAVTKGLNPDVEMKDSGIEWIGEIPKHWGIGTIGKLFDYIGGYAFDSNDFSNEESNSQVLRIGNIRNDHIILDDKQVFVPDEIVKNIVRFKIEYDDILFSMTGTKGKRDYFYTVRFDNRITNKNIFINQRVGCLRKRLKISPMYYNYLLKDNRILDSIFLYETGTANQGNLGIETIKRTKIQVPPYEEQQLISNYLEKQCFEIESLISQKEALISDLESYKKSLIYECVTGKREVY